MPRVRGAAFDAQRASILEQAARAFATAGFHGASMAQIAHACGVSKALLYHYHRDKAQLLFDIVDSYMDRLLALVDEVAALALPPEAHLRELVLRFMREYEHSQARHRVLVQDVKFLSEPARATVVEKQRRVVDAFARVIADTKPRWADDALRVPLAMILFGMINWTFTWLRADGPLAYGDMADVVTGVFLHGVVAQPPRGC